RSYDSGRKSSAIRRKRKFQDNLVSVDIGWGKEIRCSRSGKPVQSGGGAGAVSPKNLRSAAAGVDETTGPSDHVRRLSLRWMKAMNNYRPTRPQHRAKSHDQAHTEDEFEDSAQSQANPLIFQGEAQLIADQAGLLKLIERLRAA